MVDRALSETLEAQQGFAGCLAVVADCLQAGGRQHIGCVWEIERDRTTWRPAAPLSGRPDAVHSFPAIRFAAELAVHGLNIVTLVMVLAQEGPLPRPAKLRDKKNES
jgi:hypothetical protein